MRGCGADTPVGPPPPFFFFFTDPILPGTVISSPSSDGVMKMGRAVSCALSSTDTQHASPPSRRGGRGRPGEADGMVVFRQGCTLAGDSVCSFDVEGWALGKRRTGSDAVERITTYLVDYLQVYLVPRSYPYPPLCVNFVGSTSNSWLRPVAASRPEVAPKPPRNRANRDVPLPHTASTRPM